MATVIDSLIVELTLDPKNFTAQQQAAVDSLRKFEQQVHTNAVSTETSSKRMASAFGGVKTQAIELFAAFAGVAGVAAVGSFVASTINSGSALGRFSRAVGVSTVEISKWQSVAKEFGSTGEAMASSWQNVANIFTSWQVGGPESPHVFALLSRVQQEAQRLDASQAKIFDVSKYRGPAGQDRYFKDLADNLKIIHDLSSDPNLANYLAGHLGNIDPGMFDLLITGSDNVTAALARMKGITQEEAEAAGKLDRQWNNLINTMTTAGKGAILDALGTDYKDLQWAAGRIDSIFGTHLLDKFTASPVNNSRTPTSPSAAAGASGVPGNSRGERNNNRGNIKYGSFAARHGATGQDEKGFAVFPSTEVGDAAQQALLKTSAYQNLTLAQFASKYAEGSQAWAQTVGQNLGIGLNDRVDASDPRLPSAIRKAEGTNGRSIGASSATTNVNISGPITVTGIKDATDFTNKLRDRGLKLQQEASKSPQGGQ